MAATKTASTLIASQSLAAGGAAVTGILNLLTAYGATITARLTNGGTGPTIAATVTINISTDGTTWRQFAAATGGVSNSEVDDFTFQIPPSVMYAQVSIVGNTGQAVTIESFAHTLTTI
jgi:hypothetical protein